MNKQLILLFFIYAGIANAQFITLTGRVSDSVTHKSLEGVNVYIDSIGTMTDENGVYNITVEAGDSLTFEHIGYKKEIHAVSDSRLNVNLVESIIETSPVFVEATRAIERVTPVAFSTMDKQEIERHYSVEDVPMILSYEPGVHAFSESGNGTGYSYVSIRGFDQSRIAVMVDGVPLNDNESHQVYWVDHGDLLADAQDVQIQRGVGNSLYGSSAFGGSINIKTRIATDDEAIAIGATTGSFNTKKYSLSYTSGKRLGDNISISTRLSSITSDGYREFHGSDQKSFSLSVEHRMNNLTNQLRMNLGWENTDLVWDGIPDSVLSDVVKRRESTKGFTDNFLQQIYSLNTDWRISDIYRLTNTAYFVTGSGYYETTKYGVDWYSYNLDTQDAFPDSLEAQFTTDVLRRKWIRNYYTGIVPTFIVQSERLRLDIGSEFRLYHGDHSGEVTDFTDTYLQTQFGDSWYTYYQYDGSKSSQTTFIHAVFDPAKWLTFMADLQLQSHDWTFVQEKIGHASGHKLDAIWTFLNPRFGVMWQLSKSMEAFIHYGEGMKEPADNQIIQADDVTETPKNASAEAIRNYEAGFRYHGSRTNLSINAYSISYNNEQLKNINIEQEGEYEYTSAEKTFHAGVELDGGFSLGDNILTSFNATFSSHQFSDGALNGHTLPTVPGILMNGFLEYSIPRYSGSLSCKYVGKQFLDTDNIGTIDHYIIVNGSVKAQFGGLEAKLMINNLLNTLYETYGYGFEWDDVYYAYYWPGATQAVNLSLNYRFRIN